MYSKLAKLFLKIYVVIILLSATTLYEPIGKKLGESIFLKENQHYKLGSTTFSGSTLYEGRTDIYIYRKDLLKTIKLDKISVQNIAVN
ncbi:MAG: hypothetical protein JJW00_06345 [Sulfurimonas sp.]|nr:hypothetical protein [Sulfurimonas sp.]